MTFTLPSDAELLLLMSEGEESACARLFQRHQGAVYRFALLMCGSPNIAEEVTQEVFLFLIREPQRFDGARGTLAAYLHGVARNHVLRALKRERPYVPLLEEAADEDSSFEVAAADDPLGDCARNEMIGLVRHAVLSLPPHYREVVVLCDFQEMSCAEAAAVLDCAIGTVNSRLHRGHALLLKKLHPAVEADAVTADGLRMRCFA